MVISPKLYVGKCGDKIGNYSFLTPETLLSPTNICHKPSKVNGFPGDFLCKLYIGSIDSAERKNKHSSSF